MFNRKRKALLPETGQLSIDALDMTPLFSQFCEGFSTRSITRVSTSTFSGCNLRPA
jgi:hypothetical protein